ncbi:MAG: PEP-CTERM sorting domain-containing protein [Phycisphaerales bacterium]|nr:MAG: PEP-CTERM sorting domain-containing protein [Phycisphaerales bacterium]
MTAKLTSVTPLAAVLWSASGALGAAIDISAYAWTDSPGGLSAVVPGDAVHYQIGVAVDPDFDPLGRPQVVNRGLATIVYDMISLEAEAQGIGIDFHEFAESGYANYGESPIADTSYAMYETGDGTAPHYRGGWGFDVATDKAGGDPWIRPGSIIGAGGLLPLTWAADMDPLLAGLQPFARLDVGHGVYTFPDDDPVLAGLQGGFGMFISDPDNIVEGDGTWVIKKGHIDTTAWAPGTYNYDLIPTHGALLSGTADYNQDLGGGFRVLVDPADMTGDSFAFTIIPEPATAALLLLAAAAAMRRRPQIRKPPKLSAGGSLP